MGAAVRLLFQPLQARGLDLADLLGEQISRAIWRRNSANVLGGSGAPSGVRSAASRSGAVRRGALKPRMPRRASVPPGLRRGRL